MAKSRLFLPVINILIIYNALKNTVNTKVEMIIKGKCG